MKSYYFLLIVCLFALPLQAQETYTMIIDGKSFPVELNKSFTYITPSGDSVEFQLQKEGDAVVVATPTNSFASYGNNKTYEDTLIKFDYPENFATAKNQPVNGMQQITMVSGQGGGIIIQEYSSINPKELVSFFLTQLVGEQAADNAQKVNTTINGQKVKGQFAIDEEGNKVAVYSHGKAQQGILLALIGDDSSDDLLRDFLQNFEFKY